MTTDVTRGYKLVVPKGAPDAKRVNILSTSDALNHESNTYDGDECLVLHPAGTVVMSSPDSKERNVTLQGELDRIRAAPRLAMLNLPVVRGLQDTVGLWNAWKTSMLETLNAIFEQRCQLLLQERMDHDDQETRQRLRNYRMQLQTTTGTWREHQKFLDQERHKLDAGIVEQEAAVRESRRRLEQKCAALAQGGPESARCVSAARVLVNAATALEATQNERRALIRRWHDRDRGTYADTLRALTGALGHFAAGFARDVDAIKTQAMLARAAIDRSIRQKQTDWAEVCRRLQGRYDAELHRPLRELLRGIRRADTGGTEMPSSLEVAAGALDNHNDPHCIRRCEVALSELVAVREFLRGVLQDGPGATPDDDGSVWDDAALRDAKGRRNRERDLALAEHNRRMDALAGEDAARRQALARAQSHLERLREQAEQLRAQGATAAAAPAPLGGGRVDDQHQLNRRAAAMARLAQQRRANLQDEIERTGAIIGTMRTQLEAFRNGIAHEDRLTQARGYHAVATALHDLCQRMRAQFESAIDAEEMMRRIVDDQFADSARSCHGLTVGIVHKVLDTARSQAARAQVELNALNDEVQGASRRIDTLNKARIEQELRVDGPEIAVYTALEEHVVQNNQLHELRDALTKTEAMGATCGAAMAFLTQTAASMQQI